MRLISLSLDVSKAEPHDHTIYQVLFAGGEVPPYLRRRKIHASFFSQSSTFYFTILCVANPVMPPMRLVLGPLAVLTFGFLASKSFSESPESAQQLMHSRSPKTKRLKISEYLEVVPVAGKDLGVTAFRDIPAYTTILKETPAAVARHHRTEIETCGAIIDACSQMTPNVRAQYETLHEGTRPFNSQHVRIWKANSFHWSDRRLGPGRYGAIFLHLSRVNHSCLPNAEYHADEATGQMIVVSTEPIRTGEEVTICYGDKFEFMIASERNAYLQWVYGFTCKCRACADPGFAPKSDRLRRELKDNYYCGVLGRPKAPDYSAKALGMDGSRGPSQLFALLNDGHQDRINYARPIMVELFRRQAKLTFDAGMTGTHLLQNIFDYSCLAMAVAYNEKRNKGATIPVQDLTRLIQALQISKTLMSQLWPKSDIRQKKWELMVNQQLNLFGVAKGKLLDVTGAQEMLVEIMSKEPDPLATKF